jgi:serine/threonine protein kinase
MHRRNIVHRDIKLDNVLINDIDSANPSGINVKIADFGLSCQLETPPDGSEPLIFERCGTPCYVAPEVLRDQGYGTKCDIFSLGSVLFNLITGRFLFKGANKKDMLLANAKCHTAKIVEALLGCSPQCKDLMKLMLCADP